MDAQTASHEPGALPFTLAAAAGDCLAWWHASVAPARDLAVVLCSPIGDEAVYSYPSLVQLARSLALRGIGVLRFDYPGTGDAPGDFGVPGSVQAWRGSVRAAIERARQFGRTDNVVLLGIRAGALLAAAEASGCAGLVLWAAPASGRAFVRELHVRGDAQPDGSLLVSGDRYDAATLADMSGLAVRTSDDAPGRVLVVHRQDLPSRRVPGVCGSSRAVEQCSLAGYPEMVSAESAEGLLPDVTLQTLGDWLQRLAPERANPEPPDPGFRTSWMSGAARETLLRMGPGLAGVLCDPAAPRHGPLVILPNMGANPRFGPHRVHVKLARELAAQGYSSLRLDLRGLGDSFALPVHEGGALYNERSAEDIRQALAAMRTLGYRDAVVAGICSGAYVAFQAAVREPSVRGLVLVNVRMLQWTPRGSGSSWSNAPELHVRTARAHAGAVLTARNWRRLLQGELGWGWWARRLAALAHERMLEAAALVRGPAQPTVRARVQALCARGVHVLVLVGERDEGRGYVEYHFGAAGSRLHGTRHFRMASIPGGEHVLQQRGNVETVAGALAGFLRELAPAPADGARSTLNGSRRPASA